MAIAKARRFFLIIVKWQKYQVEDEMPEPVCTSSSSALFDRRAILSKADSLQAGSPAA
ncbi:hypothetical protein [Polaromonas sp. DSR2-3-2]|uniref:hypothetical protein n=1 Tax=unclassified Polaromonas TaxID=2638319 RepID=UPI003CE8AC7C